MLGASIHYPPRGAVTWKSIVGKRAVLMVEEGQPEYIEQELATLLRRADIQTPLHGKDLLALAGEYSAEVMAGGLLGFLERYLPPLPLGEGRGEGMALAPPPYPSPKGGGTESARAWLQGNRDRRSAIVAEISKHGGQPLPARAPGMCIGCPERPVFSALTLAQDQVGQVHIAGDGGFWHNGLLTGVQSALSTVTMPCC